MVTVFLTINDELPNTELEKIGEVLPRIEVLYGIATLVDTYWPPGEGGGDVGCVIWGGIDGVGRDLLLLDVGV